MGLFGTDASTSANDNRVGATDQARVNRGNVGTLTETGGVTIGARGELVGAGAVRQGDKGVLLLGGGSNVTGVNGPVNITSSDPAVVQAALDKISGLSDSFGKSLADVINAANATSLQMAASSAGSQAQSVDAVTNALSDSAKRETALIQNQAAAGGTFSANIIFYLAVAGMALAGYYFYYRSKRA